MIKYLSRFHSKLMLSRYKSSKFFKSNFVKPKETLIITLPKREEIVMAKERRKQISENWF